MAEKMARDEEGDLEYRDCEERFIRMRTANDGRQLHKTAE